MNRFSILSVVLILLFILCSSIVAETAETENEQNMDIDAASIDPYNPDAGEFLKTDISQLNRAAYEAYREGNYEKSAKYYLKLLQYDIRNSNGIYNLACCYGLLGEDTLASDYLKLSFKAGFEDVGHIKNDPDFEKVRETAVFKAAIDSVEYWSGKKLSGLGEFGYIEAKSLLRYRIHYPEGYDSEKEYNLVIGLHGYGDSFDNFSRLWNRMENPKFVYAALQAPYPMAGGKNIGYSWNTWDQKDESIGMKSQELTGVYVAETARMIKDKLKIGDIYLIGFSQGGGLTFTAGIANYKVFDGVICFGGWLDTNRLSEKQIKKAKDLRVFIAHGKNDRMVQPDMAIEARDILIKNGYAVDYSEFEGGHTIDQDALKAAVDWLYLDD